MEKLLSSRCFCDAFDAADYDDDDVWIVRADDDAAAATAAAALWPALECECACELESL